VERCERRTKDDGWHALNDQRDPSGCSALVPALSRRARGTALPSPIFQCALFIFHFAIAFLPTSRSPLPAHTPNF
jgi:hypothetical protein